MQRWFTTSEAWRVEWGKSRREQTVGRYDIRMRSRLPLLLLAGVCTLLVLPALAHAAGIPNFGNIVPKEINLCAANWNGLIVVVNNIISFLITMAIVFVAPISFGYAGFLYVVNPVNPSGRSQANSVMMNTVIGIVIALAGWLIVDAVMAVFYNPTTVGSTWYSLVSGNGSDLCLKVEGSLQKLNQSPGASGVGLIGTDASGNYTTAGSCVEPTGASPCSTANLKNTCFASRLDQAAQICQIESGGDASILSGTDKLDSGSGPSYSVGLWQINLTTSQIGGLDCPSAFSGKCSGKNLIGSSHPGWCTVKITNQDLYTKCVKAAQVPANNSQVACQLYGSSSTFQPWTYSANRCNIPTSGG